LLPWGNCPNTEIWRHPPNPNFPIGDGQKNLVLHALFKMDGAEITLADSIESIAPGDNMFVSLTLEDPQFVQTAWVILKENGEVLLDL
jgi:uncharacterized glyoxalase superfamily protein PhnB